MLDQKLVAASAIALAVTLFSIFSMRPLARKLGLVDKPDGRKRHNGRVPLVGGLCFFLGTLVGLSYLGYTDHFVMSLVAGSALIVATGLIDDFHDLSVRSRLVVEVCIVSWVLAVSGIYVDEIGKLLGSYELRLGLLGIPFTIIAVIGLINAFNMLDGIDGLAASMAMITIGAMLAYGDFVGPTPGVLLLMQILFAALIPYVCVNLGWPDGRKIFMGDAGSTLIGFLLAWSLIYLSDAGVARLAPVDVLWCVALPVMDTLGVMYRRVRLGRSPFVPDRQHLHYLLLDAGYPPRVCLLVIVAIAILLTAVGYLLRNVHETVSALLFLAILVCYLLWLPKAIDFVRRLLALRSFDGAWPVLIRAGGFSRGMISGKGWERKEEKPARTERTAEQGENGPAAVSTSGANGSQLPLKALCVMAASPGAIRIAPIVQKLSQDKRFESKICVAHMSKSEADQAFSLFDIQADFSVDAAKFETDSAGITSFALGGMERVLNDVMPDVVLVPGNTPAMLATSLAAYSRDIPIVCMSASEPRSENPASHWADDADGKIIRTLAALHLASDEAVGNELMSEGIPAKRVLVVGNDDACQRILEALVDLRPARTEPEITAPGIGTAVSASVEEMQKAS